MTLALASPIWGELRDAHGDAAWVPDELRRLHDAWDRGRWDALAGRLWQHGLPSPAAFAIAPHLMALLDRAADGIARDLLWVGFGLTAMAHTPRDLPPEVDDAFRAAVEAARAHVLVERATAPAEPGRVPHIVWVEAALYGGEHVAYALWMMASAELQLECPTCDSFLTCPVESGRLRLHAEDDDAPPRALTPTEPGETDDRVGAVTLAWLEGRLAKRGADALVPQVRDLYGTAPCPTCEETFELLAAVRSEWQATDRSA